MRTFCFRSLLRDTLCIKSISLDSASVKFSFKLNECLAIKGHKALVVVYAFIRAFMLFVLHFMRRVGCSGESSAEF